MIPTSLVPWVIVALALTDTTLSGYRTAAGRDGRVSKAPYYRAALVRGFRAGVIVCVVMAIVTAIVVFGGSNGRAVYADLVGIGQRMIPIFAVFASLVIASQRPDS